jgi:ribosome-associated protein
VTLHDDQDEDDTTSRSDLKRARRAREDALSRLATDLGELTDKQLERLELPESVLDALDEVRRIKSLRARGRQLRVVRSALRDANWPEIRARLDQLRVHGSVQPISATPERSRDAEARAWVVRLLGEGDKAVDAIVASYPSIDRRHLARLVANAASGSGERRKRAELKLIQALRSLI